MGLRFNGTLNGEWRWAATGKYLHLLRGLVYSHLEDVDSRYETLRNTQRKGRGFMLAMTVERAYSGSGIAALRVEPYFQYWKVRDSDVSEIVFAGSIDGYGWEPENKARMLGLRVGLVFR